MERGKTEMIPHSKSQARRLTAQGALCRHGKPIASARDLHEYILNPDRASCRRRGDCDCPICVAVCWDGRCKREADSE